MPEIPRVVCERLIEVFTLTFWRPIIDPRLHQMKVGYELGFDSYLSRRQFPPWRVSHCLELIRVESWRLDLGQRRDDYLRGAFVLKR